MKDPSQQVPLLFPIVIHNLVRMTKQELLAKVKPKELAVLKEVSVYEHKANALVINETKDMESAVVLLSETNRVADKIKEQKELLTRPAQDILNEVRLRYKPVEVACANAIATVRNKMMAYQREVERVVAEKEAKLLARVEKGTMRPETAVSKMEALPDVKADVRTEAGMVEWRSVQKLVIEDGKLIPREYLDVNEVRIKAAFKEGKVVAGCKMITERVPANFR